MYLYPSENFHEILLLKIFENFLRGELLMLFIGRSLCRFKTPELPMLLLFKSLLTLRESLFISKQSHSTLLLDIECNSLNKLTTSQPYFQAAAKVTDDPLILWMSTSLHLGIFTDMGMDVRRVLTTFLPPPPLCLLK